MKPTLLFYCQHVLGMGHLVRSREIVKGLGNFQVCFVNGGESVEGFAFPRGVEIVSLPPIASDTEFRAIHAVDGRTLADLQEERRRVLLDTFARVQPDVIVIEMFPFGRRKFAFELVPLLEAAAVRGTRVVSSVRDILVGKRDLARHEQQAVDLLNRYFHRVLVHSDPGFQPLGETFTRIADVTCPITYTGFVAEPVTVTPGAAHDGPPRLLASAGGGRVGFPLMRAVVGAGLALGPRVNVDVCAGPYLPDDQFAELQAMASAAPWIRLERFAPDFVERMASADVLVSMAGYNTCMNILATGVRALVHPFTGNGNQEQTIRARKLEQLGLLGVLDDADFAPERLAQRVDQALAAPASAGARLDLDGVGKTALALEELAYHA